MDCIGCLLETFFQWIGFPLVLWFVALVVPGSQYITCEELEQILLSPDYKDPRRFFLIDTRRPDEFFVSHITNATNVHSTFRGKSSMQELKEKVEDAVDKDTLIVVYCAVGLRSAWMARFLTWEGYTNVKVLYRGYYEWANEGRPILSRYPLTMEDEVERKLFRMSRTNETVHRCVGECYSTVKVMPQHWVASLVLDRKISTKEKFPSWMYGQQPYHVQAEISDEDEPYIDRIDKVGPLVEPVCAN